MPTIAKFKREYYLVGGTAIALQIGQRESIDFDLFKLKSLRKSEIYKKIEQDKLNPTCRSISLEELMFC